MHCEEGHSLEVKAQLLEDISSSSVDVQEDQTLL
jgi:hypothetical protein